MSERRLRIVDDSGADDVADMLDELYAANRLLVDELDRILESSPAAGTAPPSRHGRLAEHLRAGVRARGALAAMESTRMNAGVRVWLDRHRTGQRGASA